MTEKKPLLIHMVKDNLVSKLYNSQLTQYKSKRKTRTFTPGSLGSVCLRKIYYNYVNAPKGTTAKNMLRIFDVGSAIESAVMEKLEKTGKMIKYVLKPGEWTIDGQWPVKSKDLEINYGFIDGVVKDNEDGIWLVEVKSCKTEKFNSLQCPSTEHLVQGSLYYYMFNKHIEEGDYAHVKELEPYKKVNGIVYLYYDKNTSRLKEYKVYGMEDVFVSVLEKILKVSQMAAEGKLPDKTPEFCSYCPFKKICDKDQVFPGDQNAESS